MSLPSGLTKSRLTDKYSRVSVTCLLLCQMVVWLEVDHRTGGIFLSLLHQRGDSAENTSQSGILKKKESLQCCFNQFNPFGKDNPTVVPLLFWRNLSIFDAQTWFKPHQTSPFNHFYRSCPASSSRKWRAVRFQRHTEHLSSASSETISPTLLSFVAHTQCPSVWPRRTQMEAHSVLAAPHNNCAEMCSSSTATDRAQPSMMGCTLWYSRPT